MTNSIVLAGGKALRLGRDKLFENIGGKNLISRVLNTLTLLHGDIIVVTGAGKSLKNRITEPCVKAVTDIFPESGVLGGIYTGLAASDSVHSLVVAGDMPFLNLALLRYILDQSDNFDAVIPRIGNFIEPLHAVYSRRCMPYIKAEMDKGSRNIRSFFPSVKIKYIEKAEIDRFDPGHLSFFNINTEDDLIEARKIASRLK